MLHGGAARKGKGKGKASTKNADGTVKKYSVSHSEFAPTRCMLMYPNKDTKLLTKPAAEGYPAFEDMAGLQLLQIHGAGKASNQKSVEELNKCAIALSESAACLLELLAFLKTQQLVAVPVLNPVLLPRLIGKFEQVEHSLQMLDLSRDVPRDAAGIKSAVAAFFQFGAQLNAPHYAAFFAAVTKAVPYLCIGAYRVNILTAMAMNPSETHKCLTPSEDFPQVELAAWAAQPSSMILMGEFFAAAVSQRVGVLEGLPQQQAPAALAPANAMAGLLAPDSDEDVPAAAAPVLPVAAPAASSASFKRKRGACEWCQELTEVVLETTYEQYFCCDCTEACK